MNYSTAVFLINDDVRGVLCTYEKPANERVSVPKTLFKSFDQSLKVGDYVVVPTDTRHGMTVVQVSDVDVDYEDHESGNVEWIVGRVNQADFDLIKRQEQDAITAIKSAEKKRKRRELRESLLADAEDEIKLLPICTGGTPSDEPEAE